MNQYCKFVFGWTSNLFLLSIPKVDECPDQSFYWPNYFFIMSEVPNNSNTKGSHNNLSEKDLMRSQSKEDRDENGSSNEEHDRQKCYVYTDFSHMKAGPKHLYTNFWDRNEIKQVKLPVKLNTMLSDKSLSTAITWLPHGRSFMIIDRKMLAKEALPCYFGHSNVESFLRLVNAWGFRRVPFGIDRDSYYHELFLRGMPHLHARMKRLTKDQGKTPVLPDDQCPNFYDMPPLPDEPMTECIGGKNMANSNERIDDPTQDGGGISAQTAKVGRTLGVNVSAGSANNVDVVPSKNDPARSCQEVRQVTLDQKESGTRLPNMNANGIMPQDQSQLPNSPQLHSLATQCQLPQGQSILPSNGSQILQQSQVSSVPTNFPPQLDPHQHLANAIYSQNASREGSNLVSQPQPNEIQQAMETLLSTPMTNQCLSISSLQPPSISLASQDSLPQNLQMSASTNNNSNVPAFLDRLKSLLQSQVPLTGTGPTNAPVIDVITSLLFTHDQRPERRGQTWAGAQDDPNGNNNLSHALQILRLASAQHGKGGGREKEEQQK